MKPIAALLLGVFPMALVSAPNAQVARVRSVYLLPMTNGFDQYLANRLTNLGVFSVVTDPAKADAVLTDRIGEALQKKLTDLFPEPKPEPPAAEPKKAEPAKSTKPAAAPKGAEAAAAKGEEAAGETKKPAEDRASFTVGTPESVPASSFHRAKGTLFLVDAHERTVLWSVYAQPKNSTAAELDRTAGRIAGRLKKEIAKK
ncbi:MAG TPA: hypothetical protein VF767_04400 [Bryobacteraceae bacterium]